MESRPSAVEPPRGSLRRLADILAATQSLPTPPPLPEPEIPARPLLEWILLAAVLLVALAFRLVDLEGVLDGFHLDECRQGYDAWCLAETGMDRTGRPWPLVFDGYGDDYHWMGYTYLIALSIKAFGPTVWAARFPAVIFGVLTVAALFLLVRFLYGWRVALLASLFLAVSPWHVYLSRQAVRGVSMHPFFLLGALFLFMGLRDSRCYRWAALALGASLYTYTAANIYVPLCLAAFLFLAREHLEGKWRHLLQAGLILGLIAIPALDLALSPRGAVVFKGRSFIPHVPPLDAVILFSKRMMAHFDPRALYGQEAGWLPLVEGPLFLLGVIRVAVTRRAASVILLGWLLIYPIAASMTDKDYLNVSRAFMGCLLLPIFAALGAHLLLLWRPRKVPGWSVAAPTLLTAWLVLHIFQAHHIVFERFPVQHAWFFHHGYQEAVEFFEERAGEIDTVFVSDRLLNSYCWFHIAFFSKYPPRKFHEDPVRQVGVWTEKASAGNRRYAGRLGRYVLGPLPDLEPDRPRTAYLVAPDDYAGMPPDRVIETPDGHEVMKIYLGPPRP